ncbi:bifunctional adenosylcobinamide kinase/adenosylcobinamide-phosphate guanylyltransferase [Parasphingorhabdus litoris]|uniref:Bifunctional adenosylcobalamin biosynthesis protein n=1 Tax=Parasphingorhabdus litoris TaxID=394733 RepID=A0ABP3K0L3_9SPHN|nr:bifunctional adenosylcobinamide kinase/adenosylcobinamide-phosphate guanylyltransferase [Parasphingorhabdus litoris]
MPTKSDRSGHVTLVLGGTRSGKSSFAQRLAEESEGDLVYIATAQAFDEEMSDRIARHKQDRGKKWQTIEEPFDLAEIVSSQSSRKTTLLIDCLTIWLSNLMLANHDTDAALENFVSAISSAKGQIILVSNEVGSGIVPETALGRRFRDEAGWMNQRIAAATDEVALVTAGLPLWLKQDSA